MELSGQVERITFRNEDNGYTVLRLRAENGELHAVVGTMPSAREGENLKLFGDFDLSAKFGRQFKANRYESVRPTSTEGIRSLLSSGFVDGIGPHLAEIIVGEFGEKTFDILDNHPDKLLDVKGIGKRKLPMIKASWQGHRHLTELTLFLQDFGVSAGMIAKIHKAYGDNAKMIIQTNPYALINDIWGVGFHKADAIAKHFGFDHDSPRRRRAGIFHTLSEASGEGHVMLPQEDLIRAAAALLECDEMAVASELVNAAADKTIVIENNCCYTPSLYKCECKAAKLMLALLASSSKKDLGVSDWIERYSAASGWRGDPKQIAAVKLAATSTIMILTGGPGTGKTTTLSVIVAYFKARGKQMSLCAPTGKAAQRMGEVTGMSAKTIHRLLEYKPTDNGMRFTKCEHDPLETDVLIVDESSMIDIALFTALLSAVTPGTHMILVGDSDQLPSVGPGAVLSDCIASGVIPHVGLTTVFRQAAQSRIVTVAHEIIGGTVPAFANAAEENCFMLTKKEPEEAAQAIVELVCDRIPAKYGFDPIRQIQVLTPMHRGPIGTIALNKALQARLNKSETRIERGDTIFSYGDRVMQLRNNYETGVFNGDIGYVCELGEDGMVVDFDGSRCPYALKNLDELVHAYAISIHKSQGCEFDAAVIVVSTQHYVMLQRNLLYTAITRAKKLCIIVGTHYALSQCVKSDLALRRNTRLASRLTGR